MKKALGLLVAGLLAVPVAANAALIVNGGFEANAVPLGTFQNTTPTGWTSTAAVQVDIWTTGYGGLTAPEGNNYVDLIGSPGANAPTPSGLKQTVALTAGTYVLSFQYSGDAPGFGNSLQVDLGGFSDLIDTSAFNVTIGQWANFSTQITVAADGNYDLRFQSMTGSIRGPYIDNVALNAVSIPEPGTLGLIGASLAALALARKRRR